MTQPDRAEEWPGRAPQRRHSRLYEPALLRTSRCPSFPRAIVPRRGTRIGIASKPLIKCARKSASIARLFHVRKQPEEPPGIRQVAPGERDGLLRQVFSDSVVVRVGQSKTPALAARSATPVGPSINGLVASMFAGKHLNLQPIIHSGTRKALIRNGRRSLRIGAFQSRNDQLDAL